MRQNRKIAKSEREEYKWPRWVITICFIVLIVAYFFLLTSKKFDYDSPLLIVVAIAAGVLLITLGIVVKMQDKKVDLDYDSTTTWKLCVVFGGLIALFGVICLFL